MIKEGYGYIAASLTTFAFLPQLIKILRTKSAFDVSITMLFVFIVGLIFWIIYALRINSLPVLIANIITLILNLTILILKLEYDKKDQTTNSPKILNIKKNDSL